MAYLILSQLGCFVVTLTYTNQVLSEKTRDWGWSLRAPVLGVRGWDEGQLDCWVACY